MSLKIPFKYDVGQIIAGLKGKDPRAWEAFNNLNTASRDLNTLTGNIKAVALYERVTFHLPIDASGNDVMRYVVKNPVDPSNVAISSQLQITGLVLSTKAPSAGIEIDIEVSNDRGVTYATILKDTSDPNVVYDKGTLPAGLSLFQYGFPQFARNTFNDNDFLSIDLVSGDPTEELEIDLIGNYILVINFNQ